MSSAATTTSIEKENLEAHVELCAQRYQSLENRLDVIEVKVGQLQHIIQNSHQAMMKIFVGTAITIVIGITSVLTVVLTKFA
jgi:hypothetical protein